LYIQSHGRIAEKPKMKTIGRVRSLIEELGFERAYNRHAPPIIMVAAMAWLSGCGNPLGGDQSSDIGSNYRPGLQASDFTLDIPFTNGTDASYVLSDASRVQIEGNVARLTPSNQTDSDGTSTHFGGATMTGVQWDSSNAYVRLNTTTNNAELDPSWTPQWSSLVGYWKMDGAAGALADGISIPAAIGPNGTTSNTNGTGMAYITAQLNQGIYFDGADDSINLTSLSDPGNNGLVSISAWVKPTDCSSKRSVLRQGLHASYFNFSVALSAGTSNCKLLAGNSNNDYVVDFASGSVAVNQWSHIVIVFSGSNVYGYVNGILSGSSGAGTSNGTTGILAFGKRANSSGEFFIGSMDEIAIWYTPLSLDQIQTIYARQSAKYSGQLTSRVMDGLATGQSWTSLSSTSTLPFYKELPGSSGSESSANYSSQSASLMSGIVGLWHFDEAVWNGMANEVKDSSGNGYNGTRTGSPTTSSSAMFNRSGYFSASTDSVVTTSSSNLIAFANQPVTIAAWILPTQISGISVGSIENRIISIHRGSSAGSTLVLGLGNTNKLMYFNYTDTTFTSSSASIKVGQWTHVILRYNGTCFQLYINGSPDGSCANKSLTAGGSFQVRIGHFDSSSVSNNFIGYLDEVTVWNRAVTDGSGGTTNEILELYRRGANRLKHQIRSCSASDCSDQDALSTKGWKGPDNTNQTYFSELYNTTSNVLGGTVSTGTPTMTFSNFSGSGLSVSSNRYFQYRTILESDDANSLCNYGSGATACSPELQSVSVGPTHYDTTVQTITSKASIGSAYQTLTGFAETLGSNGCSAGVRYALSPDGTNYHYWNSVSSSWVASSSTYATASPGTNFSASITGFPGAAGTGTLQIMTFLKSDGTSACEVDNLQITGKKY
jgi:hypothetical protein